MAARRLLAPLALLVYTALLAYGSLYPLQGLRLPDAGDWSFLLAPRPPFVTRTDLTTNVLVYVPFGALLAAVLTRRRRLRAALPWILAAGALLSALLEVGQLFVPGRVASNVDIATNALGALLGGVAFGLLRSQRWPGRALVALRHRLVAPGRLPEAGLLLLALWFLPQLSLDAPSLLAGRLKSGFVPFWETAEAFRRVEPALALAYALEVVVVGCLLAQVLRRPPAAAWLTLVSAAGLTLAKFAGAAILLKWAVLGRLLSLEFVAGLVAGSLSLLRCLNAGQSAGARWPPLLFALGLGALLAAQNLAPDTESGFPRPFNITGLAAAVAALWPWLAALFLATRALAGKTVADEPRRQGEQP